MSKSVVALVERKDPINRIVWRHFATLKPNGWNPNFVMNQELELLEKNIMMAGWIQPILITPDGTIIDGFHRFMLSKHSPKLQAKYDGHVPCAVMEVDPALAKIMTVNMNRAKGTHAAIKMGELVQQLINEHHLEAGEVAHRLGMPLEEVTLLYENSVFKAKNLKDYRYSRAWVPAESDPIKSRGKR